MDEDIRILSSVRKLTSKNIREINQRNLASKKFSYIPYLVRVSHEIPNLRHYPTHRILEFLKQMFVAPQNFQKEIGEIGSYLKTRDDLFQAFLLLIENNQFKDDLHYWHPGLKYTNIFSFICDLFSDISSLFILHITKNLIIDNTVQWSLVEMLETKLSVTTLAQISIMKKDMEVFKNEVSCGIPKNNLPLTDNVDFQKRIISHSYWADSVCKPFSFFDIEQPSHKYRRYSQCSCFSMVEVEFVGKKTVTLIVTLKAFEDLLLKKENMKWYWLELGIIDINWNFTV